MSSWRRSLTSYQFNKPLSTPESKFVHYCYGVHGKGYGGSPPYGAAVRILCMSDSGDLKWADGHYDDIHRFVCDSMRGKKEWAMLGWVMADGSLPLGDHDRVDPALAQRAYLHLIDSRDGPAWHSSSFDSELQAKVNRQMRGEAD